MNENKGNASAIKGISWNFETSFGKLSSRDFEVFCSFLLVLKIKCDLPSQYSGLSYAKYQECYGGVLYLETLKNASKTFRMLLYTNT